MPRTFAPSPPAAPYYSPPPASNTFEDALIGGAIGGIGASLVEEGLSHHENRNRSDDSDAYYRGKADATQERIDRQDDHDDDAQDDLSAASTRIEANNSPAADQHDDGGDSFSVDTQAAADDDGSNDSFDAGSDDDGGSFGSDDS